MRFFLLGATGAVGIQLIEHCLGAFPESTIIVYARSPDKLPERFLQHESITIIKGTLDDVEALSKALEGVDVVLSALGPNVARGPFQPGGTPIAHGYEKVVAAMRTANVRRIILLGTTSIEDPHDRSDWRYKALVTGVWITARNAWKDFVAIGNLFKSSTDLEYTIVRVPVLTNSSSVDYHAGYVGDSRSSVLLSRRAYAAFVMEEINDQKWVKEMPLVTSPE